MEVVKLFRDQSVSDGLKNIANYVDSGELPDESCTLIIGTEVIHLGCVSDEQAATDAIFNMTLGIHKLMKPIFEDR